MAESEDRSADRGLTARAGGHPGEPKLCGQLRRHATAVAEAVLQSRMLVVNTTQDADFAFQHCAFGAHCTRVLRREVASNAARDDDIHEHAMAEGGMVGAQQVLFQT